MTSTNNEDSGAALQVRQTKKRRLEDSEDERSFKRREYPDSSDSDSSDTESNHSSDSGNEINAHVYQSYSNDPLQDTPPPQTSRYCVLSPDLSPIKEELAASQKGVPDTPTGESTEEESPSRPPRFDLSRESNSRTLADDTPEIPKLTTSRRSRLVTKKPRSNKKARTATIKISENRTRVKRSSGKANRISVHVTLNEGEKSASESELSDTQELREQMRLVAKAKKYGLVVVEKEAIRNLEDEKKRVRDVNKVLAKENEQLTKENQELTSEAADLRLHVCQLIERNNSDKDAMKAMRRELKGKEVDEDAQVRGKEWKQQDMVTTQGNDTTLVEDCTVNHDNSMICTPPQAKPSEKISPKKHLEIVQMVKGIRRLSLELGLDEDMQVEIDTQASQLMVSSANADLRTYLQQVNILGGCVESLSKAILELQTEVYKTEEDVQEKEWPKITSE
ncbi:hypothetical protein CJU89_5488 [Yarrowia sp. B02]|nr:hypothetical protein CJU89_5488 [Yarrowia sp. B02]